MKSFLLLSLALTSTCLRLSADLLSVVIRRYAT